MQENVQEELDTMKVFAFHVLNIIIKIRRDKCNARNALLVQDQCRYEAKILTTVKVIIGKSVFNK